MNGDSTEAGARRWASDQQIMTDRAQRAHRHHQRRVEPRQRPSSRRKAAAAPSPATRDQVAVEQRRLAGIGARHHPRGDAVARHRRSPRPTENSAAHCMPPLMPGRITTSTPTKPDADRGPAPPADPFAEHRPGQDRDQERRREQDRQRLVELQIAEREEVEDRGRDQHQTARTTCRAGPRGLEQLRPRDRIGEHQRDEERADEAHAHHLKRVQWPPRYFAMASSSGEAQHRAAHQCDADQPLAALLVRGVGQ